MKFSGEARLKATPEQVWAALHDPGTLARALPGCESLTTTGLDAYAVTVTAGVAAIKGTYDGRVAMTNQQPPTALTMTAQGVGGPGTVEASVEVRLAPDAAGGSVVTYDADAVVGGAIGGVGQRMLTGIVRKMADQFFTALDDDINGLRPEAPAVGAGPGLAEGTGLTASPELTTGTERDSAVGRPGASAPPAVGQVYAGRAGHSATASASAHLGMDSGAAFALGSVVGGALALIGVAVGARLARRP